MKGLKKFVSVLCLLWLDQSRTQSNWFKALSLHSCTAHPAVQGKGADRLQCTIPLFLRFLADIEIKPAPLWPGSGFGPTPLPAPSGLLLRPIGGEGVEYKQGGSTKTKQGVRGVKKKEWGSTKKGVP